MASVTQQSQPHVCGYKPEAMALIQDAKESTPRMWIQVMLSV